jgi:hypothetical protein
MGLKNGLVSSVGPDSRPIAVYIGPEATIVTTMPCFASSNASILVNWMTAAFAAPYSARPALGVIAPSEAILTICPQRSRCRHVNSGGHKSYCHPHIAPIKYILRRSITALLHAVVTVR